MKIGVFILILISNFIYPQTYIAKVIGIKDGDTIEILFENERKVVRLAHIDAPEKKQSFGTKAKQYVSDFCFGKNVKIVIAGRPDRYKRWIAEVFYKNQNLNKELVRNGLAWHFKKYSKNENYTELENIARAKKIGLWQDKNPVAPWDWRKTKKKIIPPKKVGIPVFPKE